MLERKNDLVLVRLLVEQNALKDQVDAAERRATSCCPEYHPTNIYWIKVDSLLKDQDKLLAKIRCFNTELMQEKTKPNDQYLVFYYPPRKRSHLLKLM